MGGSLAKVNLPTATTATAVYNANNQLTSWNGTTISYDLNGNLTFDGGATYTWNARNQLAAFGATNFTYDSFGRRTVNASAKSILYDGVNAVQELSGGSVTANLLTGPGADETFTRTDSAGVRDFLTDALGSTLALTDSSGTVQTQYSYEPFGKTTATGQTNASTFQYTGRENDGTGLYYYRARYYNPTFGRFIGEDPIGFAGGINVYAYVRNDPVNLADPIGLRPLSQCEKDRLRPYIPKNVLDAADLHDGVVPWWLLSDYKGVTIGNDIYFRPGEYDPSTIKGLAALGHELYHIEQLGTNYFGLLAYLLASVGGYYNNPFEKAAYAKEAEIAAGLGGRYSRPPSPGCPK